MQDIYTSHAAFAAVRKDGSVGNLNPVISSEDCVQCLGLRSSLGEARSMVEIAVECKMNFPQVPKHRMSCGMGHCSDAGWQCMPFDCSIALQSCAGHQVNCRALPHVLMSCEFPVHNLVAKSKYLLMYVDYILWEHHSPDHP